MELPVLKKNMSKIHAALDAMESDWILSQENLLLERREEQLKSQEKKEERWSKILEKCLNHGGPVKNLKASKKFFKSLETRNVQEKEKVTVIRNEILLRKRDLEFNSNVDLTVNKKSYEELKDTLVKILEYESSESSTNETEQQDNMTEKLEEILLKKINK